MSAPENSHASPSVLTMVGNSEQCMLGSVVGCALLPHGHSFAYEILSKWQVCSWKVVVCWCYYKRWRECSILPAFLLVFHCVLNLLWIRVFAFLLDCGWLYWSSLLPPLERESAVSLSVISHWHGNHCSFVSDRLVFCLICCSWSSRFWYLELETLK